jgi:glycosyltransferase involved in cell wall biosynthesis
MHMFRDTPQVSIGMPVYNSERHLRQALDSLLAQDYTHLEIVISDNASTDGTQEICQQYAAKDHRIHYYRNETNMGMSWNMNRVFGLARGKYFKWAGSHDFIGRSFVSRCVQELNNHENVVLAYTLVQAVDSNGHPIRDSSPEILDTKGLPDYARVYAVISKIGNYADLYYGLYRSSALRQCRPIRAFMGNDQVLLMELSILGGIALVPDFLFYRRYFGPLLTDRQRIVTDLVRMNPQLKGRRAVRPIWELGRESVAGALRIGPLSSRLRVAPVAAYAFYRRWRRQLKSELRNPYSLRRQAEPNY